MSAHTVALPARPPSPVRRYRVAVGMVVLIVAGLVVADRLLVRVVEHRLAARLSCLGLVRDGVSVHIGGFPFLAEVASGHVSSARVTAGRGGPAGSLSHVTLVLRDLRSPAMTGLVGSDVTKLSIGSATLAATVPYGTLRDRTGPGVRSTSLGGKSHGLGSAGSLPFDAHLDTLTAGPDGVRVQMSISAASFEKQAAGHRSCESG